MEMLEAEREGLYKIVKTVASPLRFFATAAVALTTIIVALGMQSKLPPDLTAQLITIAFGALILLVVLVTVLVVFWPKKLVFDQEAHLTVLRSIEMNLNPRGQGDMSPDSLLGLDLVLGSFHSALRTTEDQTERYLAALCNPHIHILGHPRGRIYNFRIGLEADWPRVFAEAVKLDKALEIDCYPDRQDLNVALLKIAREHGTRISLGTDAHHDWQLEFIDLGLAAALRAKISTERIVNFMSLLELKTWAQALRHGNASKK